MTGKGNNHEVLNCKTNGIVSDLPLCYGTWLQKATRQKPSPIRVGGGVRQTQYLGGHGCMLHWKMPVSGLLASSQ